MNKSKNVLVAIDGADSSLRTVRYVADVIGGRKDFIVHLLHVLGPLPPELREFRGSEGALQEARLEQDHQKRQEQWIERSEKESLPILEKAKSILEKSGVPTNALATEFSESVNKQDLVNDILNAGERSGCGTLVIGRHSSSWLRDIFQSHVADQLIRKGRGLVVWVVE
jgi:nucleotide-binding universal stress UspA family protein